MKIKPDDIAIPPHDPFKNDLLDRKKHILALSNLLQNVKAPYTISIDASWGMARPPFSKCGSNT